MVTVQTTISFEAAHRLYGVDTFSEECRQSVHGHSYRTTVVVARGGMLESGMVMDFKLFKKIINEVIHDKYDHSIILRDIDPLVDAFMQLAPEQKLNVVHDSPTAEWMAKLFAEELNREIHKVDPWIDVISVSVQETENNIATWTKLTPNDWRQQ